MSSTPTLSVHRLSKRFVLHARGSTIEAVRDFDLTLAPGRLTALVGPSGVGKSTVLKCIYRTYLPTSGQIQLQVEGGSVDLASANDHEVLDARRHHMSFVTQFLHCLPRQPAVEVVAAPLVNLRVPANVGRAAAIALLEKLEIPEALWGLPPATFSGGERQRINLARGLVRRSRLLLLDEPTASLDDATKDHVIELLREARAQGVAMLASLHDQRVIDELADDVIRLEE